MTRPAPAQFVRAALADSIAAKRGLLLTQVPAIARAAMALVSALRRGRTAVFFGNGGSAADAQHLAAELVGRCRRVRRALPGIALTTDTSILTALGNDDGYDTVFSRQVEALVRRGDVAIAISTRGRSPNVLRAVAAARRLGAVTIGLTGGDGGRLAKAVHIPILVPSRITSRIQEGHIAIGHILCEWAEEALFGPGRLSRRA